MQLQTFLPFCLAASSAQALSFGSYGGQVTMSEDLKVPGKNPLYYCADPKDDILDIEFVDLDPNPPAAGDKLKIKAKGDFAEEIVEGSTVHLTAKYGPITLINQDADFCDNVKKVDKECPIKKGVLEFEREVDIPAQIPPGTYTVIANVTTEEKKIITCLTATVHFGNH